MSVNCASSFNASLPTHLSTTVHVICRMYRCLISRAAAYTITAFVFANIFFFSPLCVFILNLGLKQWRKQGSSRRMSHSDLFTYHMVTMELGNIFGLVLTFCGIHAGLKEMTMLGIALFPINFSGQLTFHTLTCIDRYLAVVHPVTYLNLKDANGIRARNVIASCVWLLSFSVVVLLSVIGKAFSLVVTYCFVPTAMIIMSFCSISILLTLIMPKSGEGGEEPPRVDLMKLRALWSIRVILGVLVFRFGGNVLVTTLDMSVTLGESEQCGLFFCDFFFSMPCSLVLPLLFLQKRRKLKWC